MSGPNEELEGGKTPYQDWINEQFVKSLLQGPSWNDVHEKAEKLTSKDWQVVLIRPLSQFKKELPRLTTFLEVKELTNWSIPQIGRLETPKGILVKPPTIGLGTRCLEMAHWEKEDVDGREASTSILLTSSGSWLLWSTEYNVKHEGLKNTAVRTATRSEFQIIPEENLIEAMVGASNQPAWKNIQALLRAMAEHVTRAQRHKSEDMRCLDHLASEIFRISDRGLGLGYEWLFFGSDNNR